MNRQKYMDLINPAVVMVVKKGEDYNQGEASLEKYFPFGDYSHIQMIHLKALRLVSLASIPAGSKPNYEGIEDTLYDLMNYIVFYLDYIKEHDNVGA